MSLLLETTFGDVVLDLDVEGSPALCKNVLKLAKARYYTNTLIHSVVPGRYCQMGDPRGDSEGGCSIYGLIDSYQSLSTNSNDGNRAPPDVTQSQRRFLQSQGRLLSSEELDKKGVVVAMEIGHVANTIGSQFLITLSDSNGLKDSVLLSEGQRNNEEKNTPRYLSLGTVAEDSQNVLSKLNRAYCDDDGRPFADIRIQRALVVHDPFEDPPGMEDVLRMRGVVGGEENGDNAESDLKEGYPLAPQSPTYDKPPEEVVPVRIQADDTTLYATAGWDDKEGEYDDEDEEDEEARQKRLELQERQEEEWRQRQDTSRAVMLEMLGDRPTAEIEAPEDVLFVCKLNPLTNDEDLELIFSRFDPRAKAEIIRDPDTGSSLQYAFVEFTSKEACNEAYLKMNNALVDDRRIRVDFSQSVAKVWDRYHKQYRRGNRSGMDRNIGTGRGGGRGSFGGGRGRGRGRGPGGRSDFRSNDHREPQMPSSHNGHGSNFDRRERPGGSNGSRHHSPHHGGGMRDDRRRRSRSRSCSRSDSRDRHTRRSRSRSNDSSGGSRRRKKHRKKHRHRESSSRRKRSRSRSRSRDQERRKKKKHHRRHHPRREYSDDEDDKRERRERKHHRHRDDDRHHRRRDERSRSR